MEPTVNRLLNNTFKAIAVLSKARDEQEGDEDIQIGFDDIGQSAEDFYESLKDFRGLLDDTLEKLGMEIMGHHV